MSSTRHPANTSGKHSMTCCQLSPLFLNSRPSIICSRILQSSRSSALISDNQILHKNNDGLANDDFATRFLSDLSTFELYLFSSWLGLIYSFFYPMHGMRRKDCCIKLNTRKTESWMGKAIRKADCIIAISFRNKYKRK